jgi:hypothetical protein
MYCFMQDDPLWGTVIEEGLKDDQERAAAHASNMTAVERMADLQKRSAVDFPALSRNAESFMQLSSAAHRHDRT